MTDTEIMLKKNIKLNRALKVRARYAVYLPTGTKAILISYEKKLSASDSYGIDVHCHDE